MKIDGGFGKGGAARDIGQWWKESAGQPQKILQGVLPRAVQVRGQVNCEREC